MTSSFGLASGVVTGNSLNTKSSCTKIIKAIATIVDYPYPQSKTCAGTTSSSKVEHKNMLAPPPRPKINWPAIIT